MKKTVSLILALALCAGLAAPALAAESSGQCGDNVTWSLSNATLTIQGTGNMEDYRYNGPWDSDKVETVTIGNGVTSIGGSSFAWCSRMTGVTIPDSVTRIGYGAFQSCKSLTSIVIPDSVTSIETAVFSDCKGLRSVTLPKGIPDINEFEFSDCSSLDNVTIPDSVAMIRRYAFQNCRSLSSITIPASVTSIGSNAFLYCTSLADVYYGGSESQWKQIEVDMYGNGNAPLLNASIHYNSTGASHSGKCGENVTWTYSNGTLTISGTGPMDNYEYDFLMGDLNVPWAAYRNNITSVVIEKGVSTIGKNAFYLSGLTNVTIPDSVTSIGEDAFSRCINLSSVTIPNSVAAIGIGAFSGCTRLTSVTIPNSVVNIERSVFVDCHNLGSVTVPVSVTDIGAHAFFRCNMLKDIYYGGSESQWSLISIDPSEDPETGGNGNSPLLNATIHYNSAAVSVAVNGAAVPWTDAEPFIDENSRTMVPLRAVADAMGLDVSWDESNREAIFSGGSKMIAFPIGSTSARASGGGPVQMDTAAIIRDGRTYAPIRYLAEFFGYTVGWDAAARTVSISG